MGKILIERMEFYAFHGHYQEEQIVGNRFLVDLEIFSDMSKPAATDDLEDAINYQTAYRLVQREMKKKSSLLENIAKRILDALFDEFPALDEAKVTVRKMNPPMGGQMRAVSVSLERRRNNEF
jgi:dihydroneopterin aldolase